MAARLPESHSYEAPKSPYASKCHSSCRAHVVIRIRSLLGYRDIGKLVAIIIATNVAMIMMCIDNDDSHTVLSALIRYNWCCDEFVIICQSTDHS